jgi:RNA polymerase sigma-70 factor, ECF subfamily
MPKVNAASWVEVLADDPDIDLVAEAAEGNQHAFEALVDRYQARIISFARSYTGADADAEDLAQEVFVRIYRALRQFRGESSFRTWLYKIAVNVFRSHHARQGRQEAVWGDSGGIARRNFDPPADLPPFETLLARREAIACALAELPGDLREAVTLRDLHGLDYREIALATNAPMGTVESRIFRGRQRLRRSLVALLGDVRSERKLHL